MRTSMRSPAGPKTQTKATVPLQHTSAQGTIAGSEGCAGNQRRKASNEKRAAIYLGRSDYCLKKAEGLKVQFQV